MTDSHDSPMPPGGTEHPDRAERAVQAIPWLIIVAVVVLSFVTGHNVHVGPLMAVAPAFAGITARSPRGPLVVGAVAIVTGSVLAAFHTLTVAEPLISLTSIALISLAGFWAVSIRERQDRTLADVRGVAEVAQGVVLRPVPPRIGPLDLEVRYAAAASQARIGGDLYAVVESPYGMRAVLGDVSGKGLGAVDTAATVVGAFREAAYDEPSLRDVARRLAVALERAPDRTSEEFVTAVLLSITDNGAARLINLGHPPPLLLRDGHATLLDAPQPSPPLGIVPPGLLEMPVLDVPLRPGDRLLLYTDGTTEARDEAGEFYPLIDRAWDDRPRLGATLDRIGAEVRAHAGEELTDDAAMLLVRYAPD
ncbi:PP2C family protein-serine/threonine phosphatase [Yinghuangia seranimata]|uniref:PP2C family protein-serine/threonine phosphatase n=1 Tax=Yinghuangia seranimata TaxID=408067 RepID=UPI00248B82D1|nr:PP2C family protein-serine/threonine phosphatase [Yinghuangia seranimata]MDI2129642.1 PP2C family protein-serine/threonine phosphatase [Yinghuangia seranimata]